MVTFPTHDGTRQASDMLAIHTLTDQTQYLCRGSSHGHIKWGGGHMAHEMGPLMLQRIGTKSSS